MWPSIRPPDCCTSCITGAGSPLVSMITETAPTGCSWRYVATAWLIVAASGEWPAGAYTPIAAIATKIARNRNLLVV